MSKISVIGAGNVGATCANVLAFMNIAQEIVLLDVKEGVAEGKAMDIMQSAKLNGIYCKVSGVTSDYKTTAGSTVVVVTSGLPRKPGMSREDLIGTNSKIVKSVVGEVVKYSPGAFVIMVSNPMDTMTYLSWKACGIKKNHLIGMGGALDSSRFNYYLAKAIKCPVCDVDGIVMGAHTDTAMVPVMSSVWCKRGKINDLLSKKEQNQVIADTMVGGATLTKLLGTSAYYAPGTCAASVAKAIILDEKRVITCSVPLNGEYGQEDICLGVPVVLGKNGVERIVKYKLTEEEKEKFEASAQAQRKTNSILKEIGEL